MSAAPDTINVVSVAVSSFHHAHPAWFWIIAIVLFPEVELIVIALILLAPLLK